MRKISLSTSLPVTTSSDNPDVVVFQWIAEARGAEPYTIHATNRKLIKPIKDKPGVDVSGRVNKVIADTASTAVKRKVVFRDDDQLSVMVHLGSEKVKF